MNLIERLQNSKFVQKLKASGKYTIIVGCGRLGASLANQLSDKGENVLIIDQSEESFRKLSPDFGGIALKGDGTEIPFLTDAADAAAALAGTFLRQSRADSWPGTPG